MVVRCWVGSGLSRHRLWLGTIGDQRQDAPFASQGSLHYHPHTFHGERSYLAQFCAQGIEHFFSLIHGFFGTTDENLVASTDHLNTQSLPNFLQKLVAAAKKQLGFVSAIKWNDCFLHGHVVLAANISTETNQI